MSRHLFACLIFSLGLLPGARADALPSPPPPQLKVTSTGEIAVRLQSLQVKVDIAGGMAETTLLMQFQNPNSRVLEGNLQFPLRPGQRISAFALDIEGKLRPAVPVEKAKGRQVFEGIERRGVDPGLLELTQGNNFKLRIYPFAPRGSRSVQIKYVESLEQANTQLRYRLSSVLALTELPEDFSLEVRTHGAGIPQAEGLQFVADADGFVARSEKGAPPRNYASVNIPSAKEARTYVQDFGGETYFVTEIPLAPVTPVARRLPKVVGLLWDSSGSGRSRSLEAELHELGLYFHALRNAEVRLTRLRDRAEAIEVFRIVDGDWSALRAALRKTPFDGASALADWKPQRDVGEYLLVSDGLLNYGAQQFPTLARGQRLYALSSSPVADSARLASLSQRNGGRLVHAASDEPGRAARELLFEGLRLEDIGSTGAADLAPDTSMVEAGLFRIAGRLLAMNGALNLSLSGNGETRRMTIPLQGGLQHPLAAWMWADARLQMLEGDAEARRGEIRRLGQKFGIPTRETSLIVLERLDDYVRYDIAPPFEYLVAFEKMRAMRASLAAAQRGKQMEQVVRDFEQKVTWWEKSYPKEMLKPVHEVEHRFRAPSPNFIPPPEVSLRAPASLPAAEFNRSQPPVPAPAPTAAPRPAQNTISASTTVVSASNTDARTVQPTINAATPRASQALSQAAPTVSIGLAKWRADAPYLARMKSAPADQLYAIYLDEKPDYTDSSAFFLDCADLLMEKGRHDLALRVLSNLAEMDLENRHVLRILGYRLLQAGAPALAVPVFEKVLRLAEEEPQSFRDLGLALAAAGKHQEAVDQLIEVVLRPWDGRFAEIELIALAEINAIAANAPASLDLSRLDPRLRKNLPLDLRVVLTWDADNSDMDLWVTDPNGEPCFFQNRFTYQGGRLSRDFTGGYGPEEYSLRVAKPGKYRIEANFYGHRQQVIAGATTLQVKLIQAFGSKKAQEKLITLRLSGRGEKVYVGEFEVKAK